MDTAAPVLEGVSDLVDQYLRFGDEQKLIDVIEAAQTLIKAVIAAVEEFPIDHIDLDSVPFLPTVDALTEGIERLGGLAGSVRETVDTLLQSKP